MPDDKTDAAQPPPAVEPDNPRTAAERVSISPVPGDASNEDAEMTAKLKALGYL